MFDYLQGQFICRKSNYTIVLCQILSIHNLKNMKAKI